MSSPTNQGTHRTWNGTWGMDIEFTHTCTCNKKQTRVWVCTHTEIVILDTPLTCTPINNIEYLTVNPIPSFVMGDT